MKNSGYKLFSNKIFPLFYAISIDMLFYYVVYAWFFADTKGISSSDIFLITTIAYGVYLILQPLVILLINKIGNRASLITGCFLQMIAAAGITFLPNFVWVAAAVAVFTLSRAFFNVSKIILHNNLKAEGQEKNFGKVFSASQMWYSIITCVIIIPTGYLYAFNTYLPMILCVTFALAGFILSFFIKDHGEKIENKTEKLKTKPKVITPFVIFFFILCFLGMGGITNTGTDVATIAMKDTGLAVTLATICIFAGRIARVISNIVYKRLSENYKKKYFFIVTCIADAVALCLIACGFIFVSDLTFLVILVSIGLVILYGSRDPVQTYIQEVLNENYTGKARSTINQLISFFRYAGVMLLSFAVSSFTGYLNIGYGALFMSGVAILCIIAAIIFLRLTPKKEPAAVNEADTNNTAAQSNTAPSNEPDNTSNAPNNTQPDEGAKTSAS